MTTPLASPALELRTNEEQLTKKKSVMTEIENNNGNNTTNTTDNQKKKKRSFMDDFRYDPVKGTGEWKDEDAEGFAEFLLGWVAVISIIHLVIWYNYAPETCPLGWHLQSTFEEPRYPRFMVGLHSVMTVALTSYIWIFKVLLRHPKDSAILSFIMLPIPVIVTNFFSLFFTYLFAKYIGEFLCYILDVINYGL